MFRAENPCRPMSVRTAAGCRRSGRDMPPLAGPLAMYGAVAHPSAPVPGNRRRRLHPAECNASADRHRKTIFPVCHTPAADAFPCPSGSSVPSACPPFSDSVRLHSFAADTTRHMSRPSGPLHVDGTAPLGLLFRQVDFSVPDRQCLQEEVPSAEGRAPPLLHPRIRKEKATRPNRQMAFPLRKCTLATSS